MSINKCFLIFLILLFSSCRPEPQNDKETLYKIFDSNSFDFEIQIQGCFAGSTNHFTLEKQKSGYLLTCKETHKSILLSDENRAAFMSLLGDLITTKGDRERSTTYFRIRANNYFDAVEYDKSENWQEFNKILKFLYIIPSP